MIEWSSDYRTMNSTMIEEPVVCDNCIENTNLALASRITIVEGEMFHRCRANEDSCVDGKACPDYIEHCDCDLCYIAVGT